MKVILRLPLCNEINAFKYCQFQGNSSYLWDDMIIGESQYEVDTGVKHLLVHTVDEVEVLLIVL